MGSRGKVEIHGYVGCPFAWRIRLAAAEKGISWEWIPCDVEDPDPRAAAHNPDEHSPLLYHDGFSLLESEIQMAYVDEAFPGRTLHASAPQDRAQLRFLATRLRALDAHTEPSRPAARKKSEPALALLEEVLGGSDARPFIHGAEPGIVDATIFPFLANLHVRGLVDPRLAPKVDTYVHEMARRPSFAATRPPWAADLDR